MKRITPFLWIMGMAFVFVLGLIIGARVIMGVSDHEAKIMQTKLDEAIMERNEARAELESNRIVVLAWTALASHYTNDSSGSTMANGKPFNEDHLTVAHRGIKFGTVLILENPENGMVTSAIVTDRGPAKWTSRSLDVSLAVARRLGIVEQGEARLRCYTMVDGRPSKGD